MKKNIFLFLLMFSGICVSLSQEVLRPLDNNPQKNKETLQNNLATKETDAALTLPFRDDFSYPGPYPDNHLWADNYVFINQTFAVHPKTVGVATFDKLNQYGEIYEHASGNVFQFVADHLTSNPLRLDSIFSPSSQALTPADSVILTFYYQPQGRSSEPRERDSLVVEFLHTPGYYEVDDEGDSIWVEAIWQSVWRATGETLSTFSNDTFPYFKRAVIPITDEVFFREDFQFRFKNYSSFPIDKTPTNYAGNTNIWNVDYVTLDHGRSALDSTYYDIAFARPAQSILRNYRAMPWSHYIASPQAYLRQRFNNHITNLGNVVYDYTYWYFIQDENGNNIRTYSGGPWNIAPFFDAGYQDYQPHANPIVMDNPLPTAPAPERQFRIQHVIREGDQGDPFPNNDTIAFDQVFKDYFAYDDGVPEASYGLVGARKAAYRFTLEHQDTLEAVQIFFNRTINNVNVHPFLLTVWESLDPEVKLYQSQVLMPEFEDELNRFTTYLLDEPVLVSDTFYVGWEQTHDKFLHLGFDMTNDASENLFFHDLTQWIQSIEVGALMIRPFFGEPDITGISNPEQKLEFSIYPNPLTSGFLNIRLKEEVANPYEFQVEVFDIHGKRLHSGRFQPTLDLGHLSNGMYLLRLVHSRENRFHTLRFLISR